MSVRRKGGYGTTVLHVDGEYYGGDETDALREAIHSELAAGTLRLILDLSRCRMMNSTALSVLIEAKKRYEVRGGDVRLCGIEQGRMKTVLVASRLYDYFEHYPSEEDAVASFSSQVRAAGM